MQALLDSGDEDLQVVWLEVINWLRDENSLDDVTRAIELGQYDAAIKGVEQAAARISAEWVRQFILAGAAAAAGVRENLGRMVSFDGTNFMARSVLDLTRLELLSGLTQDTRELVQSVISRGLQRGDNPRIMARDLLDSLGLTADMEAAVDNYRSELEAGQFATARRRALADARYGEPDTSAQVDAMVANYRDAWRVHRAQLVARTEALAALHEGTEAAFQQAYASGELDPSEIGATWRCAMRPTSRDSHVQTDGQVREQDGMFTLGSGVRVRFPGDPRAPARERCNCECVILYRMTPRR